MKKTKNRYPCPMCACTETRTLSDESAVEIHEFLEVIAANFLSRYGQRIYRHYAKRTKHQFNIEKPWEHPHAGETF
jgi:hypothetical protein